MSKLTAAQRNTAAVAKQQQTAAQYNNTVRKAAKQTKRNTAAASTAVASKQAVTLTAAQQQQHAVAAQLSSVQAAVVTCSSNAAKTAQPGIIAYIMQCLVNAKLANSPVTAQQLLAQLSTQFPQRSAQGMLITVRAQLSRLPREKDFAISKVKQGRVTVYSAT